MEITGIGDKDQAQNENADTEESSKTSQNQLKNSTNETAESTKVEEALEMMSSAVTYLNEAGIEVFYTVDVAVPATAVILKDVIISDGKMMYLKVTHAKPEEH